LSKESQNRKKKFLHIITRLDMGGSAQNTILTCIGLAEKYDIILAHGPTHESKMSDVERKRVKSQIQDANDRGVRCMIIPSLIRAIHPVFDFEALLSIIRICYWEKPDIVHTHTSKAGLLGRLGAAIARVPIIIHTPHGHVFYGHFSRLVSRIFRVVERIVDPVTDITIALTNGEAKDYLKYFITRSEKLRVIHSGVDVNRFFHKEGASVQARKQWGVPEGWPVVGTIGWLLPIKGPDVLLKAMQIVWRNKPNVLLIFVGKGELELELKNEARKVGVFDRVRFLGWRDDIQNILPDFDIFAFPSLNEGMGRVIVEAMAAGKPVIASNTGGIPDLVKPGKTGFLVPPGDEKALADAILDLLNNSEKAKELGRAGRARCHRFSLESMLDKLDNLYQEVLMH
jgi:glycosyltransferase involved in cell wall biosynthesis